MVSAEVKFYDVAVIGAGPAGCSAARDLAEKGANVVLIEKASLPRYKTCGGGVLGRAFKMLPKSVQGVIEREFRSVSLNIFGTDLEFAATRPTPLVYMTMRADLDCLLAREARDSGAEVVESCPIQNIIIENETVKLCGKEQTFRAKFVIGADGVYSGVAKAGGWSELPHLAPALEWEVYLPKGDFERIKENARFDFNIIDAGYGWVFPKRDHVSAGILSTCKRSSQLQTKLEHYLKLVGINQIQKIERHGYLIPIAPRREKLACNRVLLVGDAAGLVDPITAEGISYAVMSGKLAATALLEGKLVAGDVEARYNSLLCGTILRELKAARLLAKFLYNYPKIRNWAFRHKGEKLTDFVADVVMGERGYSNALKTPSSYLKMFGLDFGSSNKKPQPTDSKMPPSPTS